MKANTVKHLVVEGFKNILSNRLVSLAAIVTVFISLSILGIFYSMINIVNVNVEALQQKVELVAFLNEDVSEERAKEIGEEIKNISTVNKVEFVSSEKGLESYKEGFEKEEDKEMQRILNDIENEGSNPIPASLSVQTKDPKANEAIRKELAKYNEIYRVSDGNLVAELLNSINSAVKAGGFVLMIVLSIASILLISSAIKVAVFVRRREIGIIKYIGATDNYVRLPFIIEGISIGVIGAILSTLTLSISYFALRASLLRTMESLMSGFILPSLPILLQTLIPIMLVISLGIGVIGSFISLKKYLHV
ncbi:cell division transport system permease protein [Clostridium collagenovorans DSM 3089]|uniref:Cell division protein FtsX n=1 Tax=Clostridium collagenovorans DSM 3089 TaxID=1121306 RepID=A0A1M5XHZ1_9CLOT|nr:permease-like cell division protein FtsX [Clostridium collagenovorans]SHH99447.1 cell division transport system permease protein [Clostridium collagenovorans DSM 3089]